VIDSGDGSEAGGRYDARVLAGLLEARCIGIGDLGEY
jgi:hypothetical protein